MVSLGILHAAEGRGKDAVRAAYACAWARLVVVAGPSATAELFGMLEADPSRAAAYAHAATGDPAATGEQLAAAGGLLGCLVDKASDLFDCLITRWVGFPPPRALRWGVRGVVVGRVGGARP